MVPVVVAVALWGASFPAGLTQVNSDNMAMVSAINQGTTKDPLLMHLLHCLHFFAAYFHITLRAEHLAGIFNTKADALSRNNWDLFFQCCPQAAKHPSVIPESLLDMLVHKRPDWTSCSWRTMFLSTLRRCHLHSSHIEQVNVGT